MTLRRTVLASSLLALSLSLAASSSAQTFAPPILDVPIVIQPTWKCRRWDLSACTTTDMANPAYRQILVLPTGYADRGRFWADFDALVSRASSTGAVWSTQKRETILYVGYFIDGGALGTSTAAFHGAIAPDAVDGPRLALQQAEVVAMVAELRAGALPSLQPIAVDVLFDDARADVSADAAPPNFIGRTYGIARMNRAHMLSAYVLTHELSHAAMGWLDEYVEEGLQDVSIRTLDVASPLAIVEASWSSLPNFSGNYDFDLSEVLAGNGSDNLSLSPYPATVWSTFGRHDVYEYEGGLGFGRGTFHMRGSNLMNSNDVMRASDDGFAYAHSVSQQGVVDTAFYGTPSRANDRIRNAGPVNGWSFALGSIVTVLLFDADKNHRFHPTRAYHVQVGWWERRWDTCFSGPVPYPCHTTVWRTAQKTIAPTKRTIRLPGSVLRDVPLLQSTLCRAGIQEATASDGTSYPLCMRPLSELPAALLPSLTVVIPYQDTTVPAPQSETTYWWRFATNNGVGTSAWTSWSSFYLR